MKKVTCYICVGVIALMIAAAFVACGKSTGESDTITNNENTLVEEDSIDVIKGAILDPSSFAVETDEPTSTDPLDKLLNDLNASDNTTVTPADNAVISKIIQLAKIEKAEILDDGMANVVVVAPDMSGIFNSLLEKEHTESLSTDELEEYIFNALEDEGNFKTFSVNVSTIEVDGKLMLDPTDEGLRNAMTGGFKDAFMEFCYKSLEVIFNSLSNNE